MDPSFLSGPAPTAAAWDYIAHELADEWCGVDTDQERHDSSDPGQNWHGDQEGPQPAPPIPRPPPAISRCHLPEPEGVSKDGATRRRRGPPPGLKRQPGRGLTLSSGMTTNLWFVLHEHRRGTCHYLVHSSRSPTQEQVVAACDIDFEPGQGEFIEILAIDPAHPDANLDADPA